LPRIVCEGRVVDVGDRQRLLDALLGAGIAVPSSCRAGACQSCLVRATRGAPPTAAQAGLRETLRAQGFFLACLAEPHEDLEVSLTAASDLEVPTRVAEIARETADVVRVYLSLSRPFAYRAGQFVTLRRADGLARSYSIATVPDREGDEPSALELHVRVLPHGRMSRWLAEGDALGAEVRLRGPSGDCFYVAGRPTQRLVLAGTGTGLAPLWGIAQDALRSGHVGSIVLWHGARHPGGLYLMDALRELARRHANFEYRPCVLEGATGGIAEGRLDDLVLEDGAFAGARVFLCGDPELVMGLRRRVFVAGVPLKDIHADAFLSAPA
jgi:CDP-4-dehydro-6-deoxyglucose reductase, E3